MSLEKGETLEAKQDFTILLSHSSDKPPRNYFPQSYKKGEQFYCTGNLGPCVLPDTSIVLGIGIVNGRTNFVPLDMVCLKLPTHG
jgi:hypothetical protein